MTSELSEWVVLQVYRVGGKTPVVDYLVSDSEGMECWASTVERARRFDSQARALIAARALPHTRRKVITGVTAVELLPGSVEELLSQARA